MPVIDFDSKGFQKAPSGFRKTKMFLKNSGQTPPTPESIKEKILEVGKERARNFIRNPDKNFAEYILSLPEENFNDYRWGMMRQIWITHFIDEIDFYDWVLKEIEEAKRVLGID
jgi:hypothetical protein